MPSRAKVLGDGSVRRQKALGMSRRLQPLHAIFALACGAMRVLATIIEVATLAMLDPGQALARGRAITLELVRDNHPWHVLQALEQLTKKLLGGLFVAPALHENVEDVVVLVDSAPEVKALPVDRQKHLIQVPFVAWLGASTLQLIRVILPKLPTPLADGFMGDVDPAFAQQFMHVAVALSTSSG